MSSSERAIIFFTLCIFYSFTFTHSKTTILDVSSSIQKTLDFFTLNQSAIRNPVLHQQRNSYSLSFDLHSRSSLHRPHYNDYKSLTLGRLHRDNIRVKSLQTRLNLAIRGITHSDLKPIETDSNLETPVISGTSEGSGEYFTRIGIGQPAKEVYMVIDTGSDVNWIQCSPCADCYQQTDPIFEPSSSSSYSPLTCDTVQCRSLDVSECRTGDCLYEVSYGDGSYTVGDFVTETISFGRMNQVNRIAIGCGHNNEGLFVGAAGLIGLGGGSLSFPSQIKASSLTYCLVDRDSDSASTLEFNSIIPPYAVTSPMLRNPKFQTFYYVNLTGFMVAGEEISIDRSISEIDGNGEGGIILDSGTAVTRLETAAYNAIRDEFLKGTKGLKRVNGVALFDLCYDLSMMKSVNVPKLGFVFSNGKVLDLPAKNYLIAVDSVGTFCFAFAPTTASLSIIGNVQQQGIRVTFDMGNSLIGFSVNNC
ncbi:protein ASPARTIC PROTEASE IN GUARD CELL 1-like [Impatiens glandulifera]|uniref:protein ASPARTIC PROTEASE IN GUARD CELL 1-like n=1 Tax=Impatiens glandulifera TaxID=253017 RepID=UPI001FB0CFBE|nr:protein ASPARTIC PROTEASE IN GUARD CELL 1-like [Impatiens glandulifera]